MKIVILLLAVLLSINSYAAKPGTGGESQPTGYLGVTSATFDGAGGLSAMYAACQSDYGDGALVCTTQQVQDSPNIAGKSTGPDGAWVRPTVIGSLRVDANYADRIIDSSGTTYDINRLNCGQWKNTASSAYGLTIMPNFGVSHGSCITARPAVCCR